jgi:chemotaxis protein MotB
MLDDPNSRPIIIKRVKKHAHGHHGGSWKVAYADFVTAMMSFFLLLWLLTATPVENLKGLADYFSPTVGIQGKLGIGFKGGRAPDTEGFSTGDWAGKGLIFGAPPSGPIVRLPEQSDPASRDNPKVKFTAATQDLAKGELEKALEAYQDIQVDVTPDGMEIQILDNKRRPLFGERDAELPPYIKQVLLKVVEIVASIPNYIRITAHTPPTEEKPDSPYPSGWELSTARANAVRRFMVENGMDKEQIAGVVGMADHELKDEYDTQSPENSRISVTLLHKARTGVHKQSAPEKLLFEKGKEKAAEEEAPTEGER